jgi:peptidoglycan/xylan/chitin deacetylase (PgdA/CDA1 family)
VEALVVDCLAQMTRWPSLAAALALPACASVPAEAPRPPEIAVTIDDLPVHAPYPPGMTALDVNRQMITALRREGVPATGFVNAVNITDPATATALREWRSAGFVLGNHTWSHPHLSQLGIDQFATEVTRDEPILKQLGARSDWRWFRYPFLDEGRDDGQRRAARQVLAGRGYRVAAVTMSFADWAWTPAYARCTAAGDQAGIAALEQLYLAAVTRSMADDRATARRLHGRDIPYVLLMHVSAMSAHMMPQVLRLYRAAGFRFISLAEAERDPAYRGDTDLRLPPPPSPPEAARAKGVKLPPPPDYAAALGAICT